MWDWAVTGAQAIKGGRGQRVCERRESDKRQEKRTEVIENRGGKTVDLCVWRRRDGRQSGEKERTGTGRREVRRWEGRQERGKGRNGTEMRGEGEDWVSRGRGGDEERGSRRSLFIIRD